MITLSIGPVLSFRGIDRQTWKVTALIGVGLNDQTPELWVEGRQAAPPETLLAHKELRYLRYDLSCQMTTAERKVEYSIKESDVCQHFTVPALHQAPRMAYVSCNGFSDPAVMAKFSAKSQHVWRDLVQYHHTE